MTNNNFLSLLLIFVPLIIVTIPTLFINMKNYGKKISFRPPPIVFSIVWPTLLILLGISWYLSSTSNGNSNSTSNSTLLSLFIILILLLAIWSIMFKYSKLSGLINIILSFCISISLIIMLFNKNKISSFLLVPLALWLIFAGILNIESIKNN
jgi:benzodiazapine receptor